jgi:hypothetical protein
MATIIKTLTEKYKKPTPKKWVKIGKAIGGLGAVITGISAFTASPWVTVSSLALTWLGSTITDFATEENSSDTNN